MARHLGSQARTTLSIHTNHTSLALNIHIIHTRDAKTNLSSAMAIKRVKSSFASSIKPLHDVTHHLPLASSITIISDIIHLIVESSLTSEAKNWPPASLDMMLLLCLIARDAECLTDPIDLSTVDGL